MQKKRTYGTKKDSFFKKSQCLKQLVPFSENLNFNKNSWGTMKGEN